MSTNSLITIVSKQDASKRKEAETANSGRLKGGEQSAQPPRIPNVIFMLTLTLTT